MDRLSGAGTAALAAAGAAATRVIAIVQAAGHRIGIDGEHVVQAIVVPPDMAAMPRRAGGIVGVVAHGETLVPVVRLEAWLATLPGGDVAVAEDGVEDDAGAAPDARIVIMGEGGRVVGLLVDAVEGMQRCAAAAVVRLFHDERPDELFARAVRLSADAPPLVLIEPGRLASLAGAWAAAAGVSTEGDAVAAPASAEANGPRGVRVNLGMFRIGDVLVGLDVTDIGELLPVPVLRPAPLRNAGTRGLCDWRDRLLPVVDIGAALGALPGEQAPGWMCVVRHGDRVLGVLVHEIVQLHATELPAGDEAAALVRHECPTQHGILQVLDTAQLMAACPESCISERAGTPARREAAATSPHTWLVFEADGTWATRIDRVEEIVPLPALLRPRLDAGLAASLEWRGHAVPVRALFADRGLAEGAQLLVVVVAQGRRAAVPIAAVKAMIAPRTATLARLRVRGDLVDVISTAAAPDRASYEVVDIEARALA